MDKSKKSTRYKVLKTLMIEDLNAVELAERMDLGVSTVREHLKTLKEKNCVDYYFKKAEKGRPKKKYSITEKGRAAFPKKYRFVLSHMLGHLKAELGDEKLHEILKQMSVDIADVEERLFQKNLEYRIEKLVKFRKDMDLYPSLHQEDGSYLLKEKNCGCLQIDEDVHEYICNLCEGVISQFVPDCEVEQLKSFAENDDSCVHKITPKRKDRP